MTCTCAKRLQSKRDVALGIFVQLERKETGIQYSQQMAAWRTSIDMDADLARLSKNTRLQHRLISNSSKWMASGVDAELRRFVKEGNYFVMDKVSC